MYTLNIKGTKTTKAGAFSVTAEIADVAAKYSRELVRGAFRACEAPTEATIVGDGEVASTITLTVGEKGISSQINWLDHALYPDGATTGYREYAETPQRDVTFASECEAVLHKVGAITAPPPRITKRMTPAEVAAAKRQALLDMLALYDAAINGGDEEVIKALVAPRKRKPKDSPADEGNTTEGNSADKARADSAGKRGH